MNGRDLFNSDFRIKKKKKKQAFHLFTIPASDPFITVSKLQEEFPNNGVLCRMRVKNAAEVEEMTVLTTDRLTDDPLLYLLMASSEPPLKARKPKRRMKPPRATNC